MDQVDQCYCYCCAIDTKIINHVERRKNWLNIHKNVLLRKLESANLSPDGLCTA